MPTTFYSLPRRVAGFLLLLSFPLAFAASAQDSTLTRLIRQHHYPLTVSGGQYGGAGWDKIRAATAKSQFVLIGEDHGLAQIPQFTAAVAQVLKPAVFVAEVDPYVAQKVTQLAAQPSATATAYLRQCPEALCFFYWAEELELVRTLRAQQVRLVGLDQVFCTTAAPFYNQLAKLVKGPAARAYLQRRATAYAAQDQAFEKLGGDDYVMTTQSQTTIDSLLLLTKSESPAAQAMAQAYATSYAIYKKQDHQARLNLMRRNLLRELWPYQSASGLAAPKMLFKFGSNHLARGLSQSVKGEFYDLGNLAQSLAEAEGKKSLHLYIIGKQGERAESDNPYFPARRTSTYTAAENASLRLFMDQVTGPAWSVFDLRFIRRAITTGKLQVADQSLQRSLMGYDYLIVIPKTTASHAM